MSTCFTRFRLNLNQRFFCTWTSVSLKRVKQVKSINFWVLTKFVRGLNFFFVFSTIFEFYLFHPFQPAKSSFTRFNPFQTELLYWNILSWTSDFILILVTCFTRFRGRIYLFFIFNITVLSLYCIYFIYIFILYL